MKKESTVLLFMFLVLAFAASNLNVFGIRKAAILMRWVMIGGMGYYYFSNKQFRKTDAVDFFFGLYVFESFISRVYSVNPGQTFQKALLL